MKKTTLIAPFDDPLSLAVAAEARVFGRAVAPLLPGADRTGRGKGAAPKDGNEPAAEVPVPWNPPSYVSARAAVLEASVRFGALDEAVLVASRGPAPALDAKPAEIEKAFQDRVLGLFWLTREILGAFKDRGTERGPGRLVIVLADRGQTPRSPVEAAVFGSLEAFAVSLSESAADSPYDIWTIQDSCPQDDLTAQYVSRILEADGDRRAGRVLKFSGKAGIFNRI